VLVVPEDAAPFDQWTAEGRALRLLVGLELDPAGDEVMAKVRELREAGACDVTIVHSYWPPAEYARLGPPGSRDLAGNDPDVVAVLEREIEARFNLHAGSTGTSLRIQPVWGRPAEALVDDAVASKADLLVVGTRQPHGWTRLKTGSSALATLRATRTPVLCVPARPRPAVAPSNVDIPVIRTALVATDLSTLGNAAVPYAYALVRAAGGAVELCHIHERQLPTPPYAPYSPTDSLPAAQHAELERRLEALIPRQAQRLDIASRVTVIDGGSAATAIVQTARRLGVDAIVLASHGRAGLTGALLASVAEEVLRHSDKPVFVVRPGS
jgi:nucleotide-binding universal stress UspA family protein